MYSHLKVRIIYYVLKNMSIKRLSQILSHWWAKLCVAVLGDNHQIIWHPVIGDFVYLDLSQVQVNT